MSKMLIIIATSFSMPSFKHNKMLELRFPGFLRDHFSIFSGSGGIAGDWCTHPTSAPTPPTQKPDHPRMSSYGPVMYVYYTIRYFAHLILACTLSMIMYINTHTIYIS